MTTTEARLHRLRDWAFLVLSALFATFGALNFVLRATIAVYKVGAFRGHSIAVGVALLALAAICGVAYVFLGPRRSPGSTGNGQARGTSPPDGISDQA